MVRASEVYLFNSYELPRRAGEMKEYSLDITIPERIGIDVIADLTESMTATKNLWKLTAIGLLALAGIWLMPILGHRISRRRRHSVQIDWECWPFFHREALDTHRQAATGSNEAES